MQSIGRVVLGGLNEGSWPPETRSDPWLSRPMRRGLGLDLPERRIGLSAHDFAQALGAPDVILTRANVPVNATTSRREGRRYVHLRLTVPDIRKLSEAKPFAWSGYRYQQREQEYEYAQTIGPAAAGDPGPAGWDGSELVALRLHLPSKVTFHNSPSKTIQRGNIIVWEQSLADRRQGVPIEAVASYRQAIALDPGMAAAHNGLDTVLGSMVPIWHVPMMNDALRNEAYFQALARAVTPQSQVLEIGTGSGLLSMMAARLGARSIVTCEGEPIIAAAAKQASFESPLNGDNTGRAAGCTIVGVFVNASVTDIVQTANTVQLDAIQLHGDEPLELLLELRRRLPGIALIRALRASAERLPELMETIQQLQQHSAADALLLDAWVPGSWGGTGTRIENSVFSAVQQQTTLPLILAGGLDADNVALAIQSLDPAGVDTAGGIETAPGLKDPAKMLRFVQAARSANPTRPRLTLPHGNSVKRD